jgi:hypothetical protein
MTKIEAINDLLNSKCDYLKHGVSVFVLHGTDIVNKRSKKPIDMKNMLEDGWETFTEPKWYDKASTESPILCWTKDKRDVVLISGVDGNMFIAIDGTVVDYATPISRKEALSFVYDDLHGNDTVAKEESSSFIGTMPGDIDNNPPFAKESEKVGNVECQTETSETTATQKDVTFSGVPPEVEAKKEYFIGLGLPEDLWIDFWMLNNFDSISILEAVSKGEEHCFKLVQSFLKSRAASDKDEIPF